MQIELKPSERRTESLAEICCCKNMIKLSQSVGVKKKLFDFSSKVESEAGADEAAAAVFCIILLQPTLTLK